jgi:hypothetical protein
MVKPRQLVLYAGLAIYCGSAQLASANPPVTLSGGDGSSFRKAVVVNARDAGARAGIRAQRNYLFQHFGHWRSADSQVIMHDARMYNVIVLVTDDHKKHTVYFDISCCWADMMTQTI